MGSLDDTSGNMTEDTIEVIYYYDKIPEEEQKQEIKHGTYQKTVYCNGEGDQF